MALGRVVDASFPLEASGELAPGAVGNGVWASDTVDAIVGYVLSPPRGDFDGDADLNDFARFQVCFNGTSRLPAQ